MDLTFLLLSLAGLLSQDPKKKKEGTDPFKNLALLLIFGKLFP
jgi:hypothetical protein